MGLQQPISASSFPICSKNCLAFVSNSSLGLARPPRFNAVIGRWELPSAVDAGLVPLRLEVGMTAAVYRHLDMEARMDDCIRPQYLPRSQTKQRLMHTYAVHSMHPPRGAPGTMCCAEYDFHDLAPGGVTKCRNRSTQRQSPKATVISVPHETMQDTTARHVSNCVPAYPSTDLLVHSTFGIPLLVVIPLLPQ